MSQAEIDLAEIRQFVLDQGIAGVPSVPDMVRSMANEKEATINRVGAITGLVGIEHTKTADLMEVLAVMIENNDPRGQILQQIGTGRAHVAQSRKPN